MSKIIAFYSSRPQVGKSTAANYLFHGYGFSPLSFADPIANFVAGIMVKIRPCEWQNISNYKDKPIMEFNGASWRDFMIAFGQAGRSVYQNVWVDIVKTEIIQNPSRNFVIDDLRFPNEYKMLKEQGAKIVHIEDLRERPVRNYETEGRLNELDFDYYLTNETKTFDAYHRRIDVMMKCLWPDNENN